MFSSPAPAQDRSILTSVSTSSQTLGTFGETLANPQSIISRGSPSSTSSSSFSPRILSLSPPVQAQDDAFAFKPVIDELHIETKPKTFIEIPQSSLPLKVSDSSGESIANNNVIDVDTDEDSVEISSLIPAIISAVNDKSTTPQEKSSLMSLLSDMVGHVQDQQQLNKSQRQQKQASDAASARRIQGFSYIKLCSFHNFEVSKSFGSRWS